ncbi:hypothetical protein [Ornithinimicrobium cryptoxanthini]|uniref:Sensory transduction regulator n=1 Tax=Ornithinimicrobium cryptoxanthini TaxID=2934161 RepID=A0ABY4YFR3_9MICO|nr:hypothetical protein [Ornithinimicrobium cryptoxanthini]USQ75609.1 hypothetical protein NF557_13455 [Ornithinimicrobium cryptoxanthini]
MTDPTSLPNFPPPPEEHPLRGRVLDALQDLKLQPDLDKDGDVKFTAQEQQLFARSLTGGQVDILRVYGQWQVADSVPADLLTRLNGCNDITLGVNLVKAGIAAGNLVLSVEQIIAPKENPKVKLQVAVSMILQAVQLWHRNVVAKAKRDADIAAGGAAEGSEHQDIVAGADTSKGEDAPKVGPWLSEGMRRPRPTDGEGPGA